MSNSTTGLPYEQSEQKPLWITAFVAIAVVAVCAVGTGIWFYRSKQSRPEPATLSGPIVEIPPAIAFRGESETATNSQSNPPSPQQISKAQQDVARNPKDPKSLNDAGTILLAAGDPTGVRLLQQAHQIAPDEPTITYNLARARYQQGNTTEAVQLAQAAVQQKPQFDEAHLLLATADVKKQDYGAADQELKQVEKQIQECALLIQGAIQLSKHQPKQALASFQQALQLASSDPNASYDTGLGFQQSGDFANAERSYQMAINQNPELAEAHYNLGAILAQKGDAQAAFDEIHKATLLDPKNLTYSKQLSQTIVTSTNSEDKIVGTWKGQEGRIVIVGIVDGQQRTHSENLSSKDFSQVTITKTGSANYTTSTGLSLRLQGDGSYTGMFSASQLAQLNSQPGERYDLSPVSIWMRGDTLFFDVHMNGTDQAHGVSQASVTLTVKADRVK